MVAKQEFDVVENQDDPKKRLQERWKVRQPQLDVSGKFFLPNENLFYRSPD
jgi:hypothetical protein